MAKIILEIEDSFKDGQPNFKFAVKVDRQGQPEHAEPTDAIICALALQRMWNSGALLSLTGLVAADVLAKREARRQAVEKAQAEAVKAAEAAGETPAAEAVKVEETPANA